MAFALLARTLFKLFRPMPKWEEKDEHILDKLAEAEK